ncbi:hypothetical protein [Roseicella aquatilis]|uniref:hypothetical protein n=1 Tax=Roseicella aquatilis TaxID=2527868 RepID=UPI001405231B|nr:hypothetical protein [Roseicella aquatilis]
MSVTRMLGGLALATLMLAGCETKPATGPLATQPTGTAESLLRQQQLQNIQSDPSRAMQNPTAVGANPGVGGIVREGTGTGGAGGAVAGQRTDGTIDREAGAPSTQGSSPQAVARQRKKAASTAH